MMKKMLLGFDIGGTKCAVVLGDMSGAPVDKVKFATKTGFDAVWPELIAATRELLAKNQLTVEDIVAVGVSCGGPLDAKRGVVMSPPNLPGWDNIPITEMIAGEFGCPAFLMNDANACALAEWRFGAGQGVDNMVFLTMGTGLGGGIVINREIYEGSSGMAGEFGHIRLRNHGPVGYGKAGSFEGFCGGNGIADHARRIAAEYPDREAVAEYLQLTGTEDYSMRSLDLAQAKGNKFARHMFDLTGEMLGHGLAMIIDGFNPDRIVIGSIFERSEALLRPAMERVLRDEGLTESLAVCQILPARLGDRIGDFACLLVAKHGLDLRGGMTVLSGENTEQVNEIFIELFRNYPQLDVCRNDIMAFYEKLVGVFASGGKLLICGNGGSASDAQHIVGELMKDFAVNRGLDKNVADQLRTMFPDGSGEHLAQTLVEAFPAISLSGEQSLNSAVINDVAADIVYSQQVYGLCGKNDALLALSTSGNSANVVNAAKVARLKGAVTLAITGQRDSQLSTLCDVCLKLPSAETYRVQEFTLPIYHTICRMLEVKFF